MHKPIQLKNISLSFPIKFVLQILALKFPMAVVSPLLGVMVVENQP